jgi:hypothetical protein
MSLKHEYPEFSSIRNHLERAEAQRSMQIGYAIADALLAIGTFARQWVSATPAGAAWRARNHVTRVAQVKRLAPHR